MIARCLGSRSANGGNRAAVGECAASADDPDEPDPKAPKLAWRRMQRLRFTRSTSSACDRMPGPQQSIVELVGCRMSGVLDLGSHVARHFETNLLLRHLRLGPSLFHDVSSIRNACVVRS
jgi:hypothetical protein